MVFPYHNTKHFTHASGPFAPSFSLRQTKVAWLHGWPIWTTTPLAWRWRSAEFLDNTVSMGPRKTSLMLADGPGSESVGLKERPRTANRRMNVHSRFAKQQPLQ